jgi:hypothetical protein
MKTIDDNLSVGKTSSDDILIVKVEIHRNGSNVSSSLGRKTSKILKQRLLVASSKDLNDLMIIAIQADKVQLAVDSFFLIPSLARPNIV